MDPLMLGLSCAGCFVLGGLVGKVAGVNRERRLAWALDDAEERIAQLEDGRLTTRMLPFGPVTLPPQHAGSVHVRIPQGAWPARIYVDCIANPSAPQLVSVAHGDAAWMPESPVPAEALVSLSLPKLLLRETNNDGAELGRKLDAAGMTGERWIVLSGIPWPAVLKHVEGEANVRLRIRNVSNDTQRLVGGVVAVTQKPLQEDG